MDDTQKAIGAKLRELRLQVPGLSQAKLGKALGGRTAQVISNWEKGIRDPGSEGLLAYADYFNVSIDYIMGRAYYSDPIDEAGFKLGLSRETAYNLRNATGGTLGPLDDLLGNENLAQLAKVIDDYCRSDYFMGAPPKTGVYFGEKPSDPDQVRGWEAFQEIVKHGIERYALSRVNEVFTDMLRQLKAAHDDKETALRNDPKYQAVIKKAFKRYRAFNQDPNT